MSLIVAFLAETYQGSYIPVMAFANVIPDVDDYVLSPHSYSMPFVELTQAQDFLRDMVPATVLLYQDPVKMNHQGFKWLSEIERAQHG